MRALPTPLLRALGTVSAVALLAFHAALLLRRLTEPGGLDAAAAWRWAGAVLILLACLALRATAGRLTPRQLLALALAAVALHAPMLQGPAEADRAAQFWIALPGLLVPTLLLRGLIGLHGDVHLVAHNAPVAGPRVGLDKSPSRAPFSPRPPPLL